MQGSIARSLTFQGVGLHGGKPVRMVVRPAAADTGVRFLRVDVTDRDPVVLARWDGVVDTRLCTVLGNAAGVTVGTVEHVMAALAAMGVDNAVIAIDGPEAPIMDGSSLPFAQAIARAGVVAVRGARRAIRVLRPVTVTRGDASATLAPAAADARGLRVEFSIAFPDPAIGRQSHALDVTADSFMAELADCRTFTRRAEIEALRKAGLALGGSLENAVVVDGARVLNRGGLRRPDEFVRHKALDAVGDLALAGAPVIGVYRGDKAGHALTNQLLRALFDQPSAWTWDQAEPAVDAPAPVARIAAE
ncbi:MAG: UDP-3-O-acyl-N-acetylglucosamine deacetylase [Rubrimonas sp.]